jgi:DNA-binding NtrC family response regulator
MTLQMFYDLRRVESADDKRRETVSHDSCAGMDTPLEGYMAACENAFIRAAQLQHQGHISETAHALGISRKSLWEKMRKHAIAAEPLH